jgi:hypothetical protein
MVGRGNFLSRPTAEKAITYHLSFIDYTTLLRRLKGMEEKGGWAEIKG